MAVVNDFVRLKTQLRRGSRSAGKFLIPQLRQDGLGQYSLIFKTLDRLRNPFKGLPIDPVS